MKAYFHPVIVTAREGLDNALSDRPPVIYVDDCVAGETAALMASRGYVRAEERGRRGVFFWRQDVFDSGTRKIYDPLRIL